MCIRLSEHKTPVLWIYLLFHRHSSEVQTHWKKRPVIQCTFIYFFLWSDQLDTFVKCFAMTIHDMHHQDHLKNSMNIGLTAKELKIFVNTTDSAMIFNSEKNLVPSENSSEYNTYLMKLLSSKYTVEKYSKNSDNFKDNFTIIIIYSLIVLISMFGNLLVLFVILKNKRMRTKTNILMANITVSDLMMTIFNIPFNMARIILNDWPFGVILCKLLPSIQVTSV